MNIKIDREFTEFNFAYPTVYDGVVYLWATTGDNCIQMTVSEFQRMLDIVAVVGWHNDGSAVAS